MDRGRDRVLPEFSHSSSQILQLAEATPAEKFAWRPGPGVRSVSEVYMHIAVTNYFLLIRGREAGESSQDHADHREGREGKAAVIAFLKDSFAAVRKAYPHRRDAEAGEVLRPGFQGRERIPADTGTQSRAHGTVDRVRPHERNRAALVEVRERPIQANHVIPIARLAGRRSIRGTLSFRHQIEARQNRQHRRE